jgi:class 3 adenylate cyclase
MASQRLTAQELERLLATQPIDAESPITSKDSPLLTQLALIDRSLLDRFVVEEHYAPGQIIFKEGDQGDAMYVIRSGRIAVVKGEIGSPTILSQAGPGAIIGEMALLEDQPRSATVVALEDLRLLRISREGFRQLQLNAPGVIDKTIMESLSSRLRAAGQARAASAVTEKKLSGQVTELQAEKSQLLDLQRLRQEASDSIARDLLAPVDSLHSIIHILGIVLPPEIINSNRELFEAVKLASQRARRLMDSWKQLAKQWPKQITVLFADISEFDKVPADMDAGDVNRMMRELWQQLDTIILEYGGQIDKHVGRSVTAWWGIEADQTDNPVQVVRAAQALQARIQVFCNARKISLSLHIGIHTGLVLIGESGSKEYAVQGSTVNTARRLGYGSPAGEILISQDTYQHVQSVFNTQLRGRVQIEGQEPIQVYVVKSTKFLDTV